MDLPISPICYFNPRSREGSDPRRKAHSLPLTDFNPRSREGSDDRRGRGLRLAAEFQSTLP